VAFGLPMAIPPDRALSRGAQDGTRVLVRGVVERWEARADGGRAWFRVVSISERSRFRPGGGRILVTWPADSGRSTDGERLELSIIPRTLTGPRNPGEWDGRRHFRRRGVDFRATLSGDSAVRARQPAPFLSVARSLGGLRQAIGASIDRRLDGFAGRFARVLLLGDRVAFLPEEEAAFRKAGVTHVLSVSGLHVGLVAATVQLVAGKRRSRISLALSAGAIWIYTLVVGAPAAAVRSAAMLTLALLARHARRRASALALLAGGVFLVLVSSPPLLFDIGFQLSVLSIAGLVGMQSLLDAIPGFAAWPKPVRVGASVLGLTLGAQLATAPITIPLWGDWPLVAPLANLLVVGLSDLILTGGFLALAFDLADRAAADRVFAVVWALSRLLGWLVEWLARLSPGVTGLLPPPDWVPAALVVAALLVFLIRAAGGSRRWQLALGIAFAFLVAALVAWPPSRPDGLRVTTLDVGQGDAILVEFPDGKVMLVDAGEGGRFDTGARVVLPAIRASRHRHLDAVVVSHEHLDHIGGLPAVLSTGRVRAFHDSGYGPEEGFAARLLTQALASGTPACLVSLGDTILVGPDYAVTVLWPPAPTSPLDDRTRPANELNDLSIVLLVEWRGRRLILAGDLESAGEAALIDHLPRGPIDFLKVGHHGSRTSTGPALVAALSPRFGAVSVGERNRFGHPSARILDRLESAGCRVHRTDEDGAGRLTWTDGEIRVESWGDGRNRGYRMERWPVLSLH
ncbi:MAG: DNA internalization-related competence protein ComEC/Rec2, partial [Candidatus Eisenbacteria bacterium]|nr:DNA internalization-related competence protein ComEC/Rec2 [Candidatus Eisenbacteria bacterium]